MVDNALKMGLIPQPNKLTSQNIIRKLQAVTISPLYPLVSPVLLIT